MRISGWSSDVCSSDLPNSQRAIARRHRREAFKYNRQVIDEAFEPWGDSLTICQKDGVAIVGLASVAGCLLKEGDAPPSIGSITHGFGRPGPEIVDTKTLENGRASCRERVWQYG